MWRQLRLLFSLLLCCSFLSCSLIQQREAIKKCKIQYDDIDIEEISTKAITLTVFLKVYNPNKYDVFLDKMTLAISINEYEFARVLLPRDLIEGNAKKKISFQAKAKFKDLKTAVKIYIKNRRNWKVRIYGTAILVTPIGNGTYKIDMTYDKKPALKHKKPEKDNDN